MRKLCLILSIPFFLANLSYVVLSQTQFRFHTLDIQKKLASNYGNCAITDSKGFLWFGTQEGLNRYDGYNFKLYRHIVSDTSSIGGNFITALCEDRNNNLWIGTSQDGLSVLNMETNTFKKYRYGSKPTDLPADYIGCIYQDSYGTMWIGTYKGLCCYNATNDDFTTYSPSTNPNSISGEGVMCILEDKNKTFWIGTSSGLDILDRKTASFKHIRHVPGNTNTPSSDFIRHIMQDKAGDIWIATDNAGISRFCPKTGKFKYYQHSSNPASLGDNQVWCLYQDLNGNILAGTINGGLNLYNERNDGFIRFTNSTNNPQSISSNSITGIVEDITGNLWFTTYGGGVSYKSPRDEAFEHYKAEANNANSLSNNTVKCFYEDDKERIWIGTDGGGLDMFDPKTKQFKAFKTENGLSSNAIMDICKADKTHIWLATWKGGICLFNTENYIVQIFKNKPNNINSLNFDNVNGVLQMPDGRLWAATHGGGVNIYDPKTKKFVNSQDTTYSGLQYTQWGSGVMRDSHDTLWISTYSGLFKIKDFKIKYYPHVVNDNTSLSGNYVYDVFEDNCQRLWVATNNGLDLYIPDKQHFKNKSDEWGITGSVQSVTEDNDGNIWFTNGTQIIKCKKNDNSDTYADLQQGQFCYKAKLKAANGDLYFGSTDGFVVVHPQKIQSNKIPPRVYLTDFQLFNISQQAGKKGSVLQKDIRETSEIRLMHNQSAFSFEFVALNYSSPGLNKYEYKLEGFDKQWIQAEDSRKATYTNISPGTYVFKVKAANNDGFWNENGASVKITILLPFWLTVWAYIIYLLIIVGLLLAYRRFILFKERLRAEVERQRELDKLKTTFFTNVSHEFRTPLTLILGPIENLIKHKSSLSEEKQQTQLNLVYRNAQRLLRLVNQLLDFSKIEAGKTALEAQVSDIIPFLQYVAEPFEALATEKNILFKVQFHVPSFLLCFDTDKIEKVVVNLLSNAFKNTPENGTITIKTYEDENSLCIEVSDTGVGISDIDKAHIFERYYQASQQIKAKQKGTGIGLALCKEFIELHSGKISVDSGLEKGSTFKILLPKGEAHLSKAENTAKPDMSEYTINISKPVSAFGQTDKELPLLLVVDDNADIREYIKTNMQATYNIIEAADGMHGMELASENLPDIIISDVMMPIADGMEFCKQIKNDRRTCHIPVILLTAKSADESKIEGFETGADDYLVKPFNMDVLKARIKNLLDNRKKLRELYKSNILAEPEAFTNNVIDSDLIKRIYEIVETNLSNPEFNPDMLARELLMSRSSLYMKINALSGESVSIFVRNIRLKKAAELLKQKKYSISEIAFIVGFSQTQYFSKCFKEAFGVKPSEY